MTRFMTAVPIAILLALPASAQQPATPGATPPDPLAGSVFPPELIMQNQEAIGLSDDQRKYMMAEIQRVQAEVMEVQWRLQRELEKLVGLLRPARTDEAQLLAQLDVLLNVEREMKRIQMTLLVRLKNRLTTEQQSRLRAIHPGGPRPPG